MTTKTAAANDTPQRLVLPGYARLPINRCNLPALILGSLGFQQHPVDLVIDGVSALHTRLWCLLRDCGDGGRRGQVFREYMNLHFLLDHPEDAGYDPASKGLKRIKADYLRIIRGWMFDADSREAAVLKGWVESRFGLLARSHKGPLTDFESERYLEYLEARARGLYNTNALEAQLDLLFAFSQYELALAHHDDRSLTLYRGINGLDQHERLCTVGPHEQVILLNNINSFSASSERADEFGDTVLECRVPCAKILFFPGLLPSRLQGEDEYIVIGGLYRVRDLSTRQAG